MPPRKAAARLRALSLAAAQPFAVREPWRARPAGADSWRVEHGPLKTVPRRALFLLARGVRLAAFDHPQGWPRTGRGMRCPSVRLGSSGPRSGRGNRRSLGTPAGVNATLSRGAPAPLKQSHRANGQPQSQRRQQGHVAQSACFNHDGRPGGAQDKSDQMGEAAGARKTAEPAAGALPSTPFAFRPVHGFYHALGGLPGPCGGTGQLESFGGPSATVKPCRRAAAVGDALPLRLNSKPKVLA